MKVGEDEVRVDECVDSKSRSDSRAVLHGDHSSFKGLGAKFVAFLDFLHHTHRVARSRVHAECFQVVFSECVQELLGHIYPVRRATFFNSGILV